MDPRFAHTLRATAGIAPARPGRRRARSAPGPGLTVTLPPGFDPRRWALRALDRTGAGWWRTFEVVRRWAERHGHAHPSPKVRFEGVPIGSWVARQRTLHVRGLLSPDRITALESLPNWAWSRLDVAWWDAVARWSEHVTDSTISPATRRGLEQLAAIPVHSGDRGARRGYPTLAEFAVDTVRRRAAGTLSAAMEHAAGRLPAWSWDLLPAADLSLLIALGDYAGEHGDLNIPRDHHDGDGQRVGQWLFDARRRRFDERLAPAFELGVAALHNHFPPAT
ncbi:helicase associated domain-containing protein, partial [Nonomuraea sp. NPDC059022]|uniref:helicase associated domain-containing protein n=1 Tax=Nonomuraea sp. NPDC059022 TaxID=3346705 RepID=UPI00368EC293